jgi:hypothetical protein
MPRRVLSTLAAASVALAVLAGCTPTEPVPTAQPTTEPTPSETPSSEPTDQPIGTPVGKSCDQLVSPDTLYIYNPNFGPVDDFTPTAGTPAASALDYAGVACRWQNETNGQAIDVSVAQLDDDTLEALKNAAYTDSQMVPTYGEEAYFSVGDDGIGVAQVFQGPYWIVAASPVFFEPGDATEIVQSVIDALS